LREKSKLTETDTYEQIYFKNKSIFPNFVNIPNHIRKRYLNTKWSML